MGDIYPGNYYKSFSFKLSASISNVNSISKASSAGAADAAPSLMPAGWLWGAMLARVRFTCSLAKVGTGRSFWKRKSNDISALNYK